MRGSLERESISLLLLVCWNIVEYVPFVGLFILDKYFKQKQKNKINKTTTNNPTLAWFNGAELSLDRPIWAGDVAPRPLGGVRVPAVAVISNSWRRKKDERGGGEKCTSVTQGQLKCRSVSGRLENHDIHESLTLLYHGMVNRLTKTEEVHQRNPFKTLYRDWSVAQFGQNWYKMKP